MSSPPASPGMFAALRRLVARVLERQATRVSALVVLSVLASLTAGLGVALLVPILPLMGLEAPSRGGGLLDGLGLHLGPALALFAAVSGLQAVAQRFQAVEAARLAETFSRDTQARLFRALQQARWEALASARASDVLHAATVELRRAASAVRLLPILGSLALVALAYTGMASWVSPLPTLAAAGAAGAVLLLARGRTAQVFRTGTDIATRWRAQTAELDQYLEGFKLARCYGAAARHCARLEEAAAEVAALQVESVARVTAGQLWLRLGTLAFLCAFLYASVRLLATPPGELLVLVYVFSRLAPLLSQVEQQLAQAAADLPASEALEQLLSRLEGLREEIPPASGPPIPLLRELVFEDVHYRYPEGGGRGVEGISLAVPAGGLTALVGPSGAGKSTLADLLLGLLTPSRGRILVDGVPLVPERLEAWRAGVGYVTQETWLFHGTIRANLAWARPQSDEADLWRALEQADAGFVRDLPEGLDTVVGDRGGKLSGGERQRLALARAFLRQPSLLVLDEPTSSLDGSAEARLMDVLEGLRGSVTVFLVTHRPGCARRADRVYRVEDGRCREELPALSTER